MTGTGNGALHAGAAGTLQLGVWKVNRLGFGAMRLCAGYAWGPPRDRAAAQRVLFRAMELGIDFIDTADSYGPEVNEALIAEALHPYPKHLLIATKGGYVRSSQGGWRADGRPEHLRRALEGSLKRLKLECVELYQLHTPDTNVRFSESVEALAACQRAGMIRHLGLSNVTVRQLNEARSIAPIVSVQNEYNVGQRSSEPVLRECGRLGIAFIPWYPLGGGASARSALLKRIASRHGATPAQVALAWLLGRSAVMLPIPGTSSLEHLQENVAATRLKLSAEERSSLDASG